MQPSPDHRWPTVVGWLVCPASAKVASKLWSSSSSQGRSGHRWSPCVTKSSVVVAGQVVVVVEPMLIQSHVGWGAVCWQGSSSGRRRRRRRKIPFSINFEASDNSPHGRHPGFAVTVGRPTTTGKIERSRPVYIVPIGGLPPPPISDRGEKCQRNLISLPSVDNVKARIPALMLRGNFHQIMLIGCCSNSTRSKLWYVLSPDCCGGGGAISSLGAVSKQQFWPATRLMLIETGSDCRPITATAWSWWKCLKFENVCFDRWQINKFEFR